MIDVLIIGSGGAGLSAALASKQKTNNVTVISKTLPTYSQTVQAQGGINAVLYENQDSIDLHVEDTYINSHKLSNKENIKFLCENAKEIIMWLDTLGVPFNRDNENKIAQRSFGGTKQKRTCYSSDYSGLKILHTLYDKCINEDINFISEYFLMELIIDDNICKGAIFLDIKSSEIKTIYSKTTIIATGGYAGIYSSNTTNSISNTADGLAVCLRAGVKLSNMEFIQFHPTTLVNSNILISESARGEGAYLIDENNNRFIDELKPRDEVSRAIYEKINKRQNVYLDMRHLGLEKINSIIPQEKKLAFEFSNIKIESELLPITPAAHYTMGGIKTDINAKTNITNLFACGECAQNSIHGANRLGGNSLLEIITFGKVAGNNAAIKSLDMNIKINLESNENLKEKAKINKILNRPNKINFYEKKEFISNLLFKNLGLFRNEFDIKNFIEITRNTKNELQFMGIGDKSKIYNQNLIEYLEFQNILDITEVVALNAKERKESRGSHYRTDFTKQNELFDKFSYAQIINKKLEIGFEDIS